MLAATSLTLEYVIIGVAATLLLGAYLVLILAPAVAAYGRVWEKFVAGLLTLCVLIALLAVGGGIGLIVVYKWDSISTLF